MEFYMVTYAKDEMIGITELGKSLGNYLDKIRTNVFHKIAIIRRNKPEAVIIPIEEYEILQTIYDKTEEKEIEEILQNMTKEEKEVSHSKMINIDI